MSNTKHTPIQEKEVFKNALLRLQENIIRRNNELMNRSNGAMEGDVLFSATKRRDKEESDNLNILNNIILKALTE